jgi:hypothetical protein
MIQIVLCLMLLSWQRPPREELNMEGWTQFLCMEGAMLGAVIAAFSTETRAGDY